MHMAIGTKHCCGVIEIFPSGQFSGIHGYGNMARRMGHAYERLHLDGTHSASNGCTVPGEDIASHLKSVLSSIESEEHRSCVLPTVLSDPFFDSVPGVWD